MSVIQIVIFSFCSVLVGASKAGIKGLGIITVALFAIAFGAKASTGILLPLLIVADILAVTYFKRFAQWKYLVKFLPAMIIGVLLGTWFGKDLPEEYFKNVMAAVILISVFLMIWWDKTGKYIRAEGIALSASSGIAAGIATMIGNLAGGFTNLFFLATRMPKNEIIGTSAWLFLIINLFKLPFHLYSWGTITEESLLTDAIFIPFIFIGFFLGKSLVSFFNEKDYRAFLLIMTTIGALVILFS